MRLICYKARCGDAFHLQYVGESGKRRNIFLDMGRSMTYTQVLKDVILNLVRDSEQIDALFLSHIHDDHIGGARQLIKDIQTGDMPNTIIGQWVYNAPRKYVIEQTSKYKYKDGVLCGIVSADKVYEHIATNNPYDVKDVIAGQVFEIDGMKVTILSPDAERLGRLREKYSNKRPLCKLETNDASVEAGCVSEDYSVPLHKFNPKRFQEDTNIENASSLAAMFEYAGSRLLWLSDSVPSVIINSLSDLGYSEIDKNMCDAVLLSHHGSSGNNCYDLLKMISASRYVISADGINRHCLPNKETVARILASTSELPVSLFFNYNDGRLMRMFKTDEPDKVKSLLDLHYLNDGEIIEI